MENTAITTADDFTAFLFGGNATVTLVSRRTGTRYTYKVKAAKDNADMFFVSTLVGSNNEDDYEYLGYVHRPGAPTGWRGESLLKAGKKGRASDVRFRGFAYVLDRAFWDTLPNNVEVYHEGNCCRCGRKLTTPESIKSGIGPECAKK